MQNQCHFFSQLPLVPSPETSDQLQETANGQGDKSMVATECNNYNAISGSAEDYIRHLYRIVIFSLSRLTYPLPPSQSCEMMGRQVHGDTR